MAGQNYLTDATFINNKTNEQTTYHVADGDNTFGIFVYVGTDPQTKMFQHDIMLDEHKYIVTDSQCQTNIPGVFAAGDVISKPLRQIVTAASDGANAATSAELFVSEQKHRLNIPVNRSAVSAPKTDVTKGPTSAIDATDHSALPTHTGQWFAKEIIQALQPIFDKLTQDVTLHQLTDDSSKSHELSSFLEEFSQLSSHLKFKMEPTSTELESKYHVHHMPNFRLLTDNDEDTGIQFSGIPTGHELNSLVLALYNIAGPGQTIDTELVQRIQRLPKTNLNIGVSLTCHFCPDVVAACQHIAAINDNVTAEMIDLQLFPELRESHHIMSVPAMIINNSDNVIFGSQSLEEIVSAIETSSPLPVH